MGKPIPYDYRVKIVQRRIAGQSYKKIAEDFSLSESGVKKIWYAYQKEGEKAFETAYSNCGSTSPYKKDVRQVVQEIRDNQQGADYVRSKLLQKHPELSVPCSRTLQRWWKKEKTNRPKGAPRRVKKK